MRSILLGAAAAVLFAGLAHADVSLPSVFGDHIVLQRDRPVPVWGTAHPNEKVTVTIAGQTKMARTNTKGRWRVVLDPMKAGGPHELVVTGRNEIRLADCLVGDVWICSGQSNMAFAVRSGNDAQAEIAAAEHPRIRLLTVPRRPQETPQADFQGAWVTCSPKTVGTFSAVGYFFGRDLQRHLDVPIGLVNTSYGGTPAEAWTDAKALAHEKKLSPLVARWKTAVKRNDKMRLHPHRPASLWNGMVAPLVPVAMRGVIWYQGESNAGRAVQYETLFPTMISAWRKRWAQGDFPFLFVQLANFKARREAPGESAWAELREAQRLTLTKLPHTGMAVIIDIGDAGNIHPKNKQDVGKRLAALALAGTYRREVVPCGPLFQRAERSGKRLVLHFEHAAGLCTQDDEPLQGFAVAGRDRHWVWAKAHIDGETVIVEHPAGKRARYVRYGWADNPACNLANGAELPASPLRTDRLPLTTGGAEYSGRSSQDRYVASHSG